MLILAGGLGAGLSFYGVWALSLWCIMSRGGRTRFEGLAAANAAGFFRCVRPSWLIRTYLVYIMYISNNGTSFDLW